MKKIYIEISDICGLKCSFCPVPKGIRGVMDLELFKKAIAESTRYTKLIALHILGDPLCVENLEQYLAVAKSANLKVEITTSGANLTNLADFDLLLNAPIKQVNFSLDALMELKNKELLLAQIVEFCKYKKAIKSQIFVNLRVQKRARNRDLVAFLESEFGVKNLVQYLGDSQICDSRVKLGERVIIDFRGVFEWGNSSLTRPSREFEKFSLDEPLVLSHSNFSAQPTNLAQDTRIAEDSKNSSLRGKSTDSPKQSKKNNKIDCHDSATQNLAMTENNADSANHSQDEFATKGTCLALKSHIGILSNGEIVPCCMDSQGILSLGNIKDTTLDSALKSQKAQKILNGFRKNRIVEPFCKACDYRKRFTKN
ncbi:radical SAM/SPASM domain-containing protein [Helicobacter sp. 23-1045]